MDTEKFNSCLLKSQRIVTELTSSLDFNHNEEVAQNLARLYGFIYNQLVQANLKKENSYIENSLRILKSLREAWQDAIGKLKESTPAPPQMESASSSEQEYTPLSIQA
jgi:flagellar protein FliS